MTQERAATCQEAVRTEHLLPWPEQFLSMQIQRKLCISHNSVSVFTLVTIVHLVPVLLTPDTWSPGHTGDTGDSDHNTQLGQHLPTLMQQNPPCLRPKHRSSYLSSVPSSAPGTQILTNMNQSQKYLKLQNA